MSDSVKDCAKDTESDVSSGDRWYGHLLTLKNSNFYTQIGVQVNLIFVEILNIIIYLMKIIFKTQGNMIKSNEINYIFRKKACSKIRKIL